MKHISVYCTCFYYPHPFPKHMHMTNISVTPITPAAWLADAHIVTQYFLENGEVPYINPPLKRTMNTCAIPFICFPCGLWSIIMRLLACPFMCCTQGTSYMCSDNGCTKLSDACIAVAYNDAHEHRKLPEMPPIETFTEEQKEELGILLAPFIGNKYTAGHYRLEQALSTSFTKLRTNLPK